MLPKRVALVTSPTGAALRDILNVLARRTRTVDILLSPTLVQGAGAAREIVRAIELVNQLHHSGERVDHNSDIPIISAVGHETDFTIADFVADVRAPTPSAAAEIVAQQEDALAGYLENLTQAMAQSVRYRLLELRGAWQEAALSPAFDDVRHRLHVAQQTTDETLHRLETVAHRAVQHKQRRTVEISGQLSGVGVQNRLGEARLRCQALTARCNEAMKSRLAVAREHLATRAAALDAMSPLAVLRRGYAVALDEHGKLLRDARAVQTHTPVRVRLARGTLHCRVEKTETF
jgi:exodeoxyribonuclease VII large subunit